MNMVRHKTKKGDNRSYSSSSCHNEIEGALSQLSIAQELSKTATNAGKTSKVRFFSITASRESTTKAAHDRKGFLDLPGEIRNAIYHMISDQLELGELHMLKDTGPTRNLIQNIPTDVQKDVRPLAIVDVNRQIREEFLSLIIFGDAVTVNITAEDLTRYGPRNMNNPHYVDHFDVSCNMKITSMYCLARKESEEQTTSGEKNKCESCVFDGNITVSFAAKFEAGSRYHRDADYNEIDTKHSAATFRFKVDNRYEFTLASRSLIEITFAQVFRTNDAVNVANLVLAAERVLSLHLDVFLVGSIFSRAYDREVEFKFSRSANDDVPEVWVTPPRDIALDSESIAALIKRAEIIEDLLRTERRGQGVHPIQCASRRKWKCNCGHWLREEDTYA